jgi:hypothetical protein
MYLVKLKFQAHFGDTRPCHYKKRAGQKCPAVFSNILEMIYGAAFVVAGAAGAAFVDAPPAGALFSLLQPLTTALKARPNSTTKDSFFIGRRNLSCFPKKHK